MVTKGLISWAELVRYVEISVPKWAQLLDNIKLSHPWNWYYDAMIPTEPGWKFAEFLCHKVAFSHGSSLCFLVNSPIYDHIQFLVPEPRNTLSFDSVSWSLGNWAFSLNPREWAVDTRCSLLHGRRCLCSGFKENSWLGKLNPNENYSINFRKGYC